MSEDKLSDPAIAKAVKDALHEFSKTCTEIESMKEHLSNIVTAIADLSGLEKKHIRKVSRLYHKQNMAEAETEFAEIRSLYKKVVG